MMESWKEIKAWLATQAKQANEKSTKDEHLLVLFDGTSTDKKSIAQSLAKEYNKELQVVNLSKLISKYIGETEKNLSAVFEKAKAVDAILFFDEADALFGKRTEVKDAHDRYANQEVSYLLQQLEKFHGLVIFSAASRKNIDEAFLRRLRIIIDFSKAGR